MKFLPLRDFDDVTSALNFDTPDCRVVGSCDLYTTKAAGTDKKLYRNIENSLESQYESLLRLSASLSPPNQSTAATSMNLSRSSPFGPLSEVSSRRTFAYLIATLNASHPDYDFSHNLRPADFRKERSLKTAMNTIDSTLYNLRPNPGFSTQALSYSSSSSGPSPSQAWGPQMWTLIDKEMTLKECSVYSYAPEEDPYDGEESAIWSLNYFFFNKARKRVAYIYLRGIPILTQSPRVGFAKRSASTGLGRDQGANKRARYWLGDRADDVTNSHDPDDEEFDTSLWSVDHNGGDDYDSFGDAYGDEYDDEADDESDGQNYKGSIRGVSEDIAARMELEI